MITVIIFVLTLLLPTAYALWEDRNGDVHGKWNKDWIAIVTIMIVSSAIVSIFDGRFGYTFNFVRSMCLSLGLYILIFDWLVVLMLVNRDVILDHGDNLFLSL
jgi:hypothetical protein